MDSRRLPLSVVTLVFGVLSVPLAFVRHLCVPATIMALLAIAFHAWGNWMIARGKGYSAKSIRHSAFGFKLAMGGAACGILMWVLWGTGFLLGAGIK